MSGTISQHGRIILLNGASSSGKSTLARRLQLQMGSPFLILSSDQLVDGGALPPQRNKGHDLEDEFCWTEIMRPRFFSGFHGCIRAMAIAGNNLIVDHIVEYPAWVEELQEMLSGLDVWTVGVHCDIAELERRELARNDRTIGEGRAHIEENRIHDLVRYHYELDTTNQISDVDISNLISAWKSRNIEGGKLSRRST